MASDKHHLQYHTERHANGKEAGTPALGVVCTQTPAYQSSFIQEGGNFEGARELPGADSEVSKVGVITDNLRVRKLWGRGWQNLRLVARKVGRVFLKQQQGAGVQHIDNGNVTLLADQRWVGIRHVLEAAEVRVTGGNRPRRHGRIGRWRQAAAAMGGMIRIGTFRGRCTDQGQGTPQKRPAAKVAKK